MKFRYFLFIIMLVKATNSYATPLVKGNTDMRVYDKDGNEITRTELPSDLNECKCEECND